MFALCPYPETPGINTRDHFREFSTIQEAVEFGKSSGIFYDIWDRKRGRTIDWTEINEDFTDEWVYNEKEFLWEKRREEE